MNAERITGLVLAGGRGTRMGSIDKGLQPFRGRPLVACVIARLAPQVGPLSISARHVDGYARFADAVVTDDGRFVDCGPLAGLLAGLDATLEADRTPYLMVTPCDVPLLPLDVVARLATAFADDADDADDAIDAAIVATPTGPHPTTCLLRATLRDALETFLLGGGRSVGAWIATTRHRAVSFDDESAFRNLNTLAELHAAEAVADVTDAS